MPSFRITHINNKKSIFIQYFNFEFLFYIPTIISLCNHMPQFRNTLRPVCMLARMGQFSPKLSITDMYEY